MEHLTTEKKAFFKDFFKNELKRIADEVLNLDQTEAVLNNMSGDKGWPDGWPTGGYFDAFDLALTDLLNDYRNVIYAGKKEGYPSIDAWNAENEI